MSALAVSALGVKAIAAAHPTLGTAPTTTGVDATLTANVDALSTVSWSFTSTDGKSQGACPGAELGWVNNPLGFRLAIGN